MTGGLPARVRETLRELEMLPENGQILAAFSGGADSAALLHLLLALREELGLTVTAAHLNHCLRGAESDRDEAFVRAECARYGVPLIAERADVAALAAQAGEGVELCARRVRYAFFERVCPPGGRIATAHTATDHTETVLLNLTRGTGLRGLGGIPPVRGRIIRPLCRITRAEVEAYCAENGVDYRTDSTNLTDDYARNRVRHHAAPALRALNPALEDAFVRMSAQARADGEFLEGLARRALAEASEHGAAEPPEARVLRADALRALPDPILARTLALACEPVCGARLDFRHIEGLCGLVRGGAGRFQLPGGVIAQLSRGRLRFTRGRVPPPEPFCVPLGALPCALELPCGRVFAEIAKNPQKIHTLFFKNAIDYDKLSGIPKLRARLSGDKLTLPGRPRKTLRRLFSESGAVDRESIPVLADDRGPCWALGLGPDVRVQADEKTERILVIRAEGDEHA